jgi:hypothetical protein
MSLPRKSCELQSAFDLGISPKRIPHEAGAEVLSHQKSYSRSVQKLDLIENTGYAAGSAAAVPSPHRPGRAELVTQYSQQCYGAQGVRQTAC